MGRFGTDGDIVATFDVPIPAGRFDITDKRTAPMFIGVEKIGVEDTEIRIRFNRFQLGLMDARLALTDKHFVRILTEERFVGYIQLVPTPYESSLIYDHHHDEDFNEENENENENHEEE